MPLRGVRVLDIADESGALATRILADLGADVLLVEPPGGSRLRHLAPWIDDRPGVEQSFAHQYHNANKRSLELDVDTDRGRADFEELVRRADVLVDAGSLDPERLSRDHPRLIHASITPFGRNAPWRRRKANDLVAGAAGGLLWLCGEPGDPPVQGAANPSLTMASLVAATGVLIALTARDRDPLAGGAHLDISIQEATAMAVMQTANASLYTWRGLVPGRPGLSAALRCKDGGWVGFVPRPDRFAGFMRWVNDAGIENELTADDWPWARVGAPGRGNPVAKATRQLAETHTREEFVERAFAEDLLCLPITDFPYMDGHPHFAENQQFLEVDHEPLGRSLGFVRSPVDALARDVPIRRAPTFDEHGAAVRAELARPAPAMPSETVPADPLRALEGVRVVDFCWVLAGPLGTRILANFGAEVIRIESTLRPDSMRSSPGPDGKIDPDLGGLFNAANTGKRSVTIDLGKEGGRELVRRLITTADVVTNNFRPGALERMGLGYDELVKLKPDVILLNMPGTHRRGPWSPRSTLGNTVMGASGYNLLMGFPEQRPRGLGVAYPDFTSPYLLATLVMAALRERTRSGRGQELDLSQLSGMISLLGVEWMQYRATGRQPPRRANRDANYCPHGVYPTEGEDEWCAIAVETDEEWAALCALMARSELARDPRFATRAGRRAREDELDALVSEWTRGQERFALADRLQDAGVAAAAVENLRDMLERDPQLPQHYQQVRQPTAPDAEIPIDGEAIRFSGHPHALERAPMLGEHSERLLCGIVGLSQQEFDQLVLDGVVA